VELCQKSEVGFQKPEVGFLKSWMESRKSEVAPQASRFKIRRRAIAPPRSGAPTAEKRFRARLRVPLLSTGMARAQQHAAVRFCRAPRQPGRRWVVGAAGAWRWWVAGAAGEENPGARGQAQVPCFLNSCGDLAAPMQRCGCGSSALAQAPGTESGFC
jgi:hypothetical protein